MPVPTEERLREIILEIVEIPYQASPMLMDENKFAEALAILYKLIAEVSR